MTLKDYQNYYSQLLIIQYNGLPKATQTVQCFVNCALADGLPVALQSAFQLSTAVGQQLTIIGKIVGVPRNVQGLDLTHTYFTMTKYTGGSSPAGFGRYASNPYPVALFRRYFTNASYVCSDFELNTLIQLKAIFNTQATTLKNLVTALYNIFGTSVTVTDNKNMTVGIAVKNPYYNVFAIASYLNIIPRALGVQINVTYV